MTFGNSQKLRRAIRLYFFDRRFGDRVEMALDKVKVVQAGGKVKL